MCFFHALFTNGGLGLPHITVPEQVFFFPHVPGIAHVHDKHLAPVRVFVRTVRDVPAEHVVAGTQVLARDAHASLGDEDRVPTLVRVPGLDITRREALLHVDALHHRIVVEHLDLHALGQGEDAAHIVGFPRNVLVVKRLEGAIKVLFARGVFRLGLARLGPVRRALVRRAFTGRDPGYRCCLHLRRFLCRHASSAIK